MTLDRNTPMHPDDRRTLGMSRAEAADYYAAQDEREAKEAAQDREIEAAHESEAEPDRNELLRQFAADPNATELFFGQRNISP